MTAVTPASAASDNRMGNLMMLLGMSLFTVNDALGKWLVADYPVAMLLAIRSLFGAVLLAAHKHGLDLRDLAPSVSWFKGVRVEADGQLTFTGLSGPGGSVDLLIHLPVVLAVANTAHPLDPAPHLTALEVSAWRADDELTTPVNSDPEYLRALFNTETTWAAAQNTTWGQP